ncbi:MAG: prepilin-type N-terminal cleavage/methylation domain-containing protein [Phycisphaerales bacterium]|nr:prepilin-type N-terminal cleavage/methylation domain-containing protein [Phycisphaerales bacterium]
MRTARQSRAFSLVELVVVIVIIGILAAIAIPRLSRGAGGAAHSALDANLSTIRNAIAMYAQEHKNAFPGPDSAGFTNKLTKYSDANGATNASKSSTYMYGPYLYAIPPCPVGENAGSNAVLIDSTNSPPAVNTAGGEGWVYNPTTGEFVANTAQLDDKGKAYNTH